MYLACLREKSALFPLPELPAGNSFNPWNRALFCLYEQAAVTGKVRSDMSGTVYSASGNSYTRNVPGGCYQWSNRCWQVRSRWPT